MDIAADSPIAGLSHLALITTDMDATVRFYDGVLGFDLCATVAAGPMRHYFFRLSAGQTIAFFEWADNDTPGFEKEAGVPPSFPTQMDHIAFRVDREADLDRLAGRLREADVEVTHTVDHGILRSIYFSDPNGIALEASWWVRDPTAAIDLENFTDPHPVPAAAGRTPAAAAD